MWEDLKNLTELRELVDFEPRRRDAAISVRWIGVQAFVFLRYPDNPERDIVFGHTPCGPAWLRQLPEDVEPGMESEPQETEPLYLITLTPTAVYPVKAMVLKAASYKDALRQVYEHLRRLDCMPRRFVSGQRYYKDADFQSWVSENVDSVEKAVIKSAR
jgi:hypothetical protein